MNDSQQQLWIVALVAIVAIVSMVIFVGRGPVQTAVESDPWGQSNMAGAAIRGDWVTEDTRTGGRIQSRVVTIGDSTIVCTRSFDDSIAAYGPTSCAYQ